MTDAEVTKLLARAPLPNRADSKRRRNSALAARASFVDGADHRAGIREHPSHPGRRLGAMRTGLTIGPPEDSTISIASVKQLTHLLDLGKINMT
jgi:hypothetical protein